MEKQVTGIDLEELKKVREEMAKEMGISSPALNEEKNLSQDEAELDNESIETNQNQLNQEENLDSQTESNETLENDNDISDDELIEKLNDFISDYDINLEESKIETSNENSDIQFPKEVKNQDLSSYDAFSQFEINSSVKKEENNETNELNQVENDNLIENDYQKTGFIESETELEKEIQKTEDLINKNTEISDGLVANLDNIDQELQDLENLDENSDELTEKQENTDDLKDETLEDDQNSNNDINLEDFEKMLDEIDETSPNDAEDLQDDVQTIIEEPEEPKEIVESEETERTEEFDQESIINSENDNEFEKLPKLDKMVIENKIDFFEEIGPLNFVNVLSSQDFKNADKFTFVLGRNEMGNVCYESFKNSYNIALFKNSQSHNLIYSMLLSLMLKNSSSEFKMALCDGENENIFANFEKSKYLFDEKIAKSDEETAQMLVHLKEELEKRYRTLAKFGVKTIDEYNLLAKNSRSLKLAHIFIVVSGYQTLMNSSNFEKIKNDLYQILRLGRIAGIYIAIISDGNISEDIINFNLPARIGFKSNEHNDSVSMIGESGIDNLANDNEFLYSSIYSDKARHLRQPTISDSIIKILIDNLEK